MYQQQHHATASTPTIFFDETIPMSASAFDGFPVRAGIDRGCSLTKIAFVPKDAPSDTDTVPLRCLTFRNADFEGALRMMKAEAQLPDKGELHVTGIGGANFKDLIEDILGLDVVFIHEFVTIGRGPYLLINNAKPEHVFHPISKGTEYVIESEMLQEFRDAVAKQLAEEGDDNSLFPAGVMYVGSGALSLHVSKDGVSKMMGGLAFSGRPLMGLSGILLGTSDYNEIMSLAAKGDQCKVDIQVKDIMKDDPNSPFGRFPPEMPVFPFAKASEPNWSRENCSREDMAQSLVSFFALEIVTFMLSAISALKLKRVYLSGNIFRAEIVRRLVYEKFLVYCYGLNIDLKIIKTGHSGAVAAMLTNAEDVGKLLSY